MKSFIVEQNSKKEKFEHFWEMCVGSCHAVTALREDYRRQLERTNHELGFQYVRFHGLFDDDMSVVIHDNESGSLKLSFHNIDCIFDFLLSIQMKPFIEIGFMPECLKSGDSTIFHFKSNTTPPNDYNKWSWLIESFVEHLIQRYGYGEVRTWYFEVWNEPNLGGPGAPYGFWAASQEEYFKLYEYTVRAIKKIDPCLKVGGPATSANAWIPEFLDFCETKNVPFDFISTHHYPTDDILASLIQQVMQQAAKSEGITNLSEVSPQIINKYRQQLEEKKKILWEDIERGTLTKMIQKVKQTTGDLPLIYTEWNSLAGIPSDGPFGASFIAKTVLDNIGLVKGYSYWTFSDIFEEDGMPHKEFHGGYGLLTLHGIAKAPYRAFELLHLLGDEMYPLQNEGTVDVYPFWDEKANALQCMVINHQSLLHKIADEKVHLAIKGEQNCVAITIEQIDDTHANAQKRYFELGEPDYLNKADLADLEAHSYVKKKQLSGADSVDLNVPAQGLALVTFYLT